MRLTIPISICAISAAALSLPDFKKHEPSGNLMKAGEGVCALHFAAASGKLVGASVYEVSMDGGTSLEGDPVYQFQPDVKARMMNWTADFAGKTAVDGQSGQFGIYLKKPETLGHAARCSVRFEGEEVSYPVIPDAKWIGLIPR